MMKFPSLNASPLATSAAAPAAEVERKIGALADAVSQLTQSQQTLVESLRTSVGGDATPAAARAGLRPEPASLGPWFDEVRRIVADTLRERDVALNRSAVRDRFAGRKMRDLPDAYRRQLPETDDERQLAAAEQEIRRQFREDFRGAGSKGASDTANGAVGGREPGAAVDYSTLSPLQQIAVGLRQGKPAADESPRGAASAVDLPAPAQKDRGSADEDFAGAD